MATNIYGGDDFKYTPATPEERGDYIKEESNDDDNTGNNNDGAGDGVSDHEHDASDSHDATGTNDDDDDAGSDDSANSDESADGEEEEENNAEEDGEEDGEEGDDDTGESDNGESNSENKKVTGQVPRHRLNKEIAKRQALEKQLQEMKSQESAAPAEEQAPASEEPEVTAEDFAKMQEAMLDENTEEAWKMFQKFMGAGQKKADSEPLDRDAIKDEIRQEMEHSRQVEALQKKSSELMKSFPELDAESNETDMGMVEEVIELRDFYINKNMSYADALDKAARAVALTNGLEDRVAAKEKKSMDKPPERKLNMEKRQKVAEKERGRIPGSSTPPKEDKRLDVINMSEDDFANLSQEERRQLRGDYRV